jgi:hypothetical protein
VIRLFGSFCDIDFRRSAIQAGPDHREARGVRCYCIENSLFAFVYSLFNLAGNSTANPFGSQCQAWAISPISMKFPVFSRRSGNLGC